MLWPYGAPVMGSCATGRRSSLGVQWVPLACHWHMVPDVAHVFNQAEVLHLVARGDLQPNITCEAVSHTAGVLIRAV